MAQSKNTSTSSGNPKPTRRTRRKPRPVTIDLEATEVDKDKPEPKTEPKDTPDAASTDKSQPASKEPKDNPSTAGQGNSFSMDTKTALRAIPYALAALLGGVLSLLVYFWLAGLGWLPGTAGPETMRMNSEIGILRDNVDKISGELETITGETIDGARSRLTALETGTAKIQTVTALEERVADLQAQLSEISTVSGANAETTENLNAQVAEIKTALASTNQMIGELESRIAEAVRGSGGAELTDLTSRMSALETILGEVSTSSDPASPASPLQIAGLRNDLQTAIDNVATAQQALQAKITAMDTQLIALQKSSRDLAANMATVNDVATERLQAMDNALAGLEIRQDAGPVSQIERRAAMALSYASLARAVEAGETFRTELDTAKAFAGDQPALDVLSPHADRGIETVTSLTERFDTVAAAIINADNASTEGSVLDRVWGKVQSIVRVRPTGFVQGDTSAAIIARAETHLQAGELTKAIDELENLTGPPLAAAQDWLDAARARRDGDAALQSLSADLIAAINANPDTGGLQSSEKDANQ